MDWMQKIIDQLDRDEPQWFTNWATGRELQEYANSVANYPGTADGARNRLKQSVANRVFHRVLNASIRAGVMEETKETQDA